VKVGGKEYTQEELEKLLAERAAQPAPAVVPTPAPAAAAPAPAAPTPEQVAKAESEWAAKFSEEEKLNFGLSTEEVETLLSGGEDAAKLFGQKITDACAKAVMLARKSIYADLNPTLERIQRDMTPLLTNNTQVEQVAAEHQFVAAYPDFKGHIDTARQVGEALLTRYPEQCAAMTREQLLAEVAAQTDRILQTEFKRWNPSATGTWREAGKTAPAAPTPALAAPAAPVQPAAAPAAPAVAPVRAPASNSPAAVAVGGQPQGWHKSTAKSLAD
jgi:hypothetical protein